jgi:pimeloyl-ACP methyl ester carboxylesterase
MGHSAEPIRIPREPDAVGARVPDAALRATLLSGRPATSEELSTGGWRCPAGRAGEGRDVLLVHGLGHDVWDWGPIVDRRPVGLALRYFDLPGFGLAGKPPHLVMADLVRAVLDAAALCDSPPLVVGASLGGHVAMLAALQRPEALAGLLLVAPGGLEPVPAATQTIARAYYSLPALLARPDAEIVGNSRRIFAKPSAAREALAARKLSVHRSAQRADYARPFASIVDDVFRHPVGARLSQLGVPAQIITGEADVVVDPGGVRRAAEIAGVPLEIYEGVGHAPMVEAPDRFAASLQRAAASIWRN